MATTYYRKDELVADFMGNPVCGVQVYLCQQPATTPGLGVAPSPLQQIYADSLGAQPITQPVLTDAYGHCAFYASPGTYSIVYAGSMIGTPTMQLVLTDQMVLSTATGPQYNSDTSANGSILPQPDGVTVDFKLSGAPALGSLALMVNGLLQLGYALSVGPLYTSVIFEQAPLPGDVITANYQVKE
jgi:hypothetical protein